MDISEALNALNLKPQGKNINIIMHHNNIRTFMAKLDLIMEIQPVLVNWIPLSVTVTLILI